MNSIENLQTSVNSSPGEMDGLVDDLERQFERFLAIDVGLALVLALWSLATHVYDCFDAFPYLGVTSPQPRCGKTRVAEVLELVCANPVRTVGMTRAVLFRSIENDKPTLMIDEAEGLRGTDDCARALREILNVGYRKGQKVRRCRKTDHGFEIDQFETYCPKVVVAIKDLPDALADRTIAIRMRRKPAGQILDRFIQRRVRLETAPVLKKCEQWATTTRAYVEATYESADLTFLEDRETELWLPLFVVCQLAAPDRLDDLEKAARRLAGVKAADDPDDEGLRLLADIRSILAKKSGDRISSLELICELTGIEGSPWEEYSYGRALSQRELAQLLHPFGIAPRDIRFPSGIFVQAIRLPSGTVRKGYMRADFEDAFARYLSPASATTLQGA